MSQLLHRLSTCHYGQREISKVSSKTICYCCASTASLLSGRESLPPEAGFTWWFRLIFSVSSTIWNQCSWGQENSTGPLVVSVSLLEPSSLSLSPLKDDWFPLVFRAPYSLLAPFEIGYNDWGSMPQCLHDVYMSTLQSSRQEMNLMNVHIVRVTGSALQILESKWVGRELISSGTVFKVFIE